MGLRRGEIPPAGEAPQALLEPERPGRQHLLELRAVARRQRLALPGTPSDLELQHETFIRGIRRSDSSTYHQPAQPSQQPLRNGPTLLTKPGNGPSSLTKNELNWHRTTVR